MKTLTWDWTRINAYLPTEEHGVFNFHLVYVCRVSPIISVNVWRVARWWQWVILIQTIDKPNEPIISNFGGGPTKNEAQWRAEQALQNAGIKKETLWQRR